MSNIEKVIEAINIPKRIVDGAEKFLGKLLGPTITESGQMFADEIRARRFRNQVTILTKAQDFLKKSNIEPKKINLKVLAPLIEYSSLEEEEEIQNVWASVIANISTHETDQSFNLKCIEILKEITPQEIIFLDFFFQKFEEEKIKTIEKRKDSKYFYGKDINAVHPSNSIFAPWDFKDQLKMTQDQIDLYVDRLISFGLIKFEEPELEESSHTVGIGMYDDRTAGVEVKNYSLNPSDRIYFTNFGLYFVKLCKFNSSP